MSLSPPDWTARFAALGPRFYTELMPTPLPAPYWVGRTAAMARELGLDPDWMASNEALQVFSGNQVLDGMKPLASVYSGHQFGQWAGQLGDGRAILLGEVNGQEVQLKGAGLTPYSRMGDGRAVLRSSIREYLCSEAMAALGIPTSRALCLTGSDQPVRRETLETAAVVTRVAPSFLRFGHFEHFYHRGRHEELKALADFALDQHFPECREADGNPYAALLHTVCTRTAELLAQWQAVGFCHGVMNTDNMSLLGLTIDYGPFQFLDAYDPEHICNHSDGEGRYAYKRQPAIAHWNLFCLGQALLPFMSEGEAMGALEPYKVDHPAALQMRWNSKLGLGEVRDGDTALTQSVLELMARDGVDFTIFWRRLSQAAARWSRGEADAITPLRDLFLQREACDAWATAWRTRLLAQTDFNAEAAQARMLATNPRLVLRNHLGELAIERARQGDFSAVERLHAALEQPFDDRPGEVDLADFPPDWASHISISCSS